MQPDDVPPTLALRSADAAVALRRQSLADLMADVREKKQELADAERLREDAVRAILGQTPPRLFPEPPADTRPESPPTATGAPPAAGNSGDWRDCSVADLECDGRLVKAVRKGHCHTLGQLADALRAGATFGLMPGEVDLLRVDVNTVAGDDPVFEPLEPPPAPRPCLVCDADIAPNAWGYDLELCSTACQRDLEATGGAQTGPAVRTCRKCGCTDADCRQCIERTGSPCSWVRDDLCSACVPTVGSLPLDEVIGFPPDVASVLTLAGVRTLAELEAAIGECDGPDALREQFGQVVTAAAKAQRRRAVNAQIGTAWDALADHLHAGGFTRPDPPAAELPTNEVPVGKRTVPVDELLREKDAERAAAAPGRLAGLPGFPVHLADLASAAGLITVELLAEAVQEKYRRTPAKFAKRAGLLGCAVQVLADLVARHEPAAGATHPYPEPGDEEGDLAAAEELLRPLLGNGDGTVKTPAPPPPRSPIEALIDAACGVGQEPATPSPTMPTGEPIGGLGVTAADLDAAVCCGTAWGKGGKTSPVKAVELNGRPHAVLWSVGTGRGGTESWNVAPLWTAAVFAQRHPGFPTRLKPSGIPANYYTGVRVRVGKAEYVIGSGGEQRRLIAAPAKPKRKTGAK